MYSEAGPPERVVSAAPIVGSGLRKPPKPGLPSGFHSRSVAAVSGPPRGVVS